MLIQFGDFGSDFSHCFTTNFVGKDVLSSGEQALIGKVAKKRERDFSTGRLCAKLALLELGYEGSDILIGKGREPLWPADITGSISHSWGLAGAIVSKKDKVQSIGLDIETIGGVGEDLWNTLFSKREQDFLFSFGGEERQKYSTLFFSLKEAFYKLQYPITGTFLEFTDVEIDYNDGNIAFFSQHAFTEAMPPLSLVFAIWLQFEDHIVSMCYLSNSYKL